MLILSSIHVFSTTGLDSDPESPEKINMKTISTLFIVTFLFSILGQAKTAQQELTELLRNTEKANTDVVLVYKDGKVIYEYYAREYTPNTKHLSWSTAKTMTAMLIGIAAKEGLLSIDEPVKKYFPEFKNEARIVDVLQMSSGLHFKEAFKGFPSHLDLTNMLYLDGQKMGFTNFMLKMPLSKVGGPGEYFNYSSGDTNLLMGILQKAIGNQTKYNNYPWQKLFNPMGIDATFEQDMKGNFVGSSYIYMKPSDYLKLGQLLMNKGVWNGHQLFSPSYFELMNTVAPGVHNKIQEFNEVNKAYSTQLTTNRPIEGRNLPSAYNDLPLDTLIMYGHQGQIVAASPSQQFVVVRLARDKKALDRKAFYKAVAKLVRSKNLAFETVGSSNRVLAKASYQPDEQEYEDPEDRGTMESLLVVPHLLRAYIVKEYCSCRLVVGRSEKACKDDMKTSFPVLPRLKIKDDGTVTATLGLGLFKKSKAVYRGQKFGCVLTQSE